MPASPVHIARCARRHGLATVSQPASPSIVVDAAYHRLYRSVFNHDKDPKRIVRTAWQSAPENAGDLFAAPAPAAPSVPPHKRSRLDLERAWDGGASETPRWDPVSKSETHRPLALLFPGSGSQYSGMGQSLLDNFASAREVWEEAEDALAGFEKWRKDLELDDVPELQKLKLKEWPSWINERAPTELRKLVFGGRQDLLTRSSNAQPAILITSLAFLRTLEVEYGTPVRETASFIAGHSSGEYTAAVTAGSITFAEGVRLTRLLGLLSSRTLYCSQLEPSMNIDAPPEHRACMTALIINQGHTPEEAAEQVEKLTKDGSCGLVEMASYNSMSQIVLAGSRAGVLCAAEHLTDLGIAARAADLPIAAPFHCSFMEPTAAGMISALQRGNIDIKAPSKPMVSSLDASIVRTPGQVRATLVKGIPRPVQWNSLIRTLREQQGVGRLIFCGPGKALASMARKDQEKGFWGREQSDHVDIGSISTLQDLQRIKEMLA